MKIPSNMNKLVIFGFLCVACGYGLSTASTPPALSDTSFLDQPVVVPAEGASPIYRDHIETVRKMASELGKKLILPEGLMEFLTKFNGGNPDFNMGGYMGGKMDTKMSIRDYCTSYGRSSLLLDWTYDASRDAIVLDFPWHKTVFREGRDLVDVLKKGSSSKDVKPEAWALAFDELLSRPENFPQAWKTRIIEDNQSISGPSGPPPVGNFFTGLLKDADSKEHLLVLNLASHDIVPSDVFLICYLFDANGKWEDGGECGGGGQFAGRKVKLDETGQALSFEITSNDPIRTYLFSVKKGKLACSIMENGKPSDPKDLKYTGVSPLRHLDD